MIDAGFPKSILLKENAKKQVWIFLSLADYNFHAGICESARANTIVLYIERKYYSFIYIFFDASREVAILLRIML